MNKAELRELRWVAAWAVLIVLITCIPYLVGVYITPPGYHYTGLTHNIDDGAVYLSWMRQAADGHFFIRNLFTNESQAARQFNILFLVMGWFAAISHLPLIWVFHLSRIVLGIALILCIWQFSKLFLDDSSQRRLLIPLVGLSAGFGWMFPRSGPPNGVVDRWQPEALTFLSMYLNPLFLMGLLLMLGAFYWLEMMRRESRARYAVFAGLHLLLLGNIHTYDVVTVACVWTAYLIALWIVERKFPARIIYLSALAAAISILSITYQVYLLHIDPVYSARANTPIPSPPIWSFFAGYGLIFICAVVAIILLFINRKSQILNRKLLPIVWAVVGFAVPYIPVAQQRKLIMGLHIPLCILGVYVFSWIIKSLREKTGRLGRVAGVMLVLFLATTNIWFLSNDVMLLSTGRTVTHYVPYLSTQELSAMNYIREHAKVSDTIFAPPTFALFVPPLTGKQVYYGHWSETPDYDEKFTRWRTLAYPDLSTNAWWYIVHDGETTYYVSEDHATDPPKALLGSYVRKCFSDGTVSIYRIQEP